MIGESLFANDCPDAISSVISGEPTDAAALLQALDRARVGGTRRFPLLSGPKIGPTWVRKMSYPGRADIQGMDAIPVAVDTHVQRVTEMLGLVRPLEINGRHRRNIQTVWFEGVRMAWPLGDPEPIDGTAAALDRALWVLGRKGCSR